MNLLALLMKLKTGRFDEKPLMAVGFECMGRSIRVSAGETGTWAKKG